MTVSLLWYADTGRGRYLSAWYRDPICFIWNGLTPSWILTCAFMSLSSPSSSLSNRMWKDAPLSMYSRFLGCLATLVIRCGVDLSPTLLNSWISDIVLIGSLDVCSFLSFIKSGVLSLLDYFFFLSRLTGICKVTLLDFLLFCRNFLMFVVFRAVCIGLNLRGSTLLGFLDGRTTSFHESTSSSGSVSKRICPKTQCLGKLMENKSVLSCSMDI